jgi:nucleoside-diphosphate-sugar epimerase
VKLEGKSVLVTGGTGFVGGRLVEKLVLEQRAHVRVLVRNFSNAPRIARFPVEMVGGDITDEAIVQKVVRGCDFVFHCAHDSRLGRDPQKLVAVQGTQNVSQAVLQEGVRRMVHVSTVAVYGPTLDGDLTESSPWQPSDHNYVQAKRAAESLVLDLHQQKSLPVVVLQPTIVYGPFCRPWTLRPINDLKTGLVPLVNGGNGYCNAVYIDDVVDAMILAATQPDVLGEIFLISGEKPISWKTFYSAFEAALGFHATVDLAEEKLEEMRRKQTHRTSVTSQLLDLARHPRFVSRVTKMPPVRISLKILKSLLPEEQRQALKSRVMRNGFKHKSDKEVGKSVHVPDETLLAVYRSRTRVRIDKAQKLLGYTPRFGFEQGMDLTTQFIHWANLA